MDAVGQRGTDRRPWGLAVAAMCAASAYIALYSLGNIRTHLLRFDALITAAMAVTVLVYRAWDTLAGDNERRAVRLVIIAAVAFRMALLWLPPSLSDDLYRYAWDGHVLANGFNPYAYAPSDPALRSLRDDSYTHLAYKEYHSIYPPVAEIGMGAAAFVSEMCGGSMRATMVVWKLLLIMAELASMLIIVQLLRLWNMPSRRLVLYAWHPLAVIEFAGQGHADALMIAGVLYAVYGIARARRGIGMLGYGFSIASRWVPLIFAPAMARAMGWRRTIIACVVACAVILPFASAASIAGIVDSTRAMGQSFVFNGFGFWLIYGVLEWMHAWALQPYITAFLAAVLAGGIVALAMRRGEVAPRDLPRALLAICTLSALVLWNMHPWYFTWGLSLLPFTLSWGWIWITFVSQFTYIHYTPRSDVALLVTGIIEYGGFIALLLMQRQLHARSKGVIW